jgi:cell division protein FtsQ
MNAHKPQRPPNRLAPVRPVVPSRVPPRTRPATGTVKSSSSSTRGKGPSFQLSALKPLLLVLLAVSAAVAVVQGDAWLKRTKSLPVRTVVVQGAVGAHESEILAYANIPVGAPLFGVDLDDVTARVLEHPYVSTVHVKRVPPDGVQIDVVERTPMAVLASDALYLVDTTGVPFKRARAGDVLDLPIISGVDADALGKGDVHDVQEALALVTAHHAAGDVGGALSEIVVLPRVGLELVLGSGVRVRVGHDDVNHKLDRLRDVLARLDEQKLQASFIYLDDARRPERASVRLRPKPGMAAVGG